MRWIEILGLPGAGKTTLLNRLIEVANSEKRERNWYAEQEIRAGIINNFKKGHLELCIKLLLEKWDFKKSKTDSKWLELINSHQKGLEGANIPRETKKKLELFYCDLISKVSRYSLLELSKPILLDEGIIHNNFGNKEDINNVLIDNSFIPLMVLHVASDVDDIITEMQSTINFKARGMGEFKKTPIKELKEILLAHQSYTRKKIDLLDGMGVNILNLKRADFENDCDLEKVNDFINENI